MGNTVDLSPWKHALGYEDFGADARHVWDMADMYRYTDAAVPLVDLENVCAYSTGFASFRARGFIFIIAS